MSIKDAIKQYEKCQECAYVDDCPKRETVIMDAFRTKTNDVTCKNNTEKETDIHEE